MKKRVKKIVIDASVARAAGNTSLHPASKGCREALLSIDASKLVVIIGGNLKEEWNKHQSKFSKSWLISVIARGRFFPINPLPQCHQLRACISKTASDEKSETAMNKDVHLLELALCSDHIVLALDEVVRTHFKALSAHHTPLKFVMWANPSQQIDNVPIWLKKGAPNNKYLMLGAE